MKTPGLNFIKLNFDYLLKTLAIVLPITAGESTT